MSGRHLCSDHAADRAHVSERPQMEPVQPRHLGSGIGGTGRPASAISTFNGVEEHAQLIGP